jgi:hypothetical protein
MIFEMRPNEQHQAAMIVRNPCTTTVSVIPEFSEHTVNTAQTTYKKGMMVHTEGGWPRDVDSTMPEQARGRTELLFLVFISPLAHAVHVCARPSQRGDESPS